MNVENRNYDLYKLRKAPPITLSPSPILITQCLHPQLGAGIKIASIEELGPGGSWSTCMMGCNQDPPRDVAHVQFNSRIAFKLVWAPPSFESFVLVDDAGKLLASGTPQKNSGLPDISERRRNFQLVEGSKYATEAVKFGASSSCQADKSC